MGAARFVNVAEVDPCKDSVTPLAGKRNPAAVAGPAMPGLATGAIGSQPVVLASLDVEQVQVTRWLVGREAAVVRHAEQHPSTVRRHPWLCDAQPRVLGQEHGFDFAPAPGVRLVPNSHQIVADLRVAVYR